MALLSLPTEILYQILECSLPYDFENLVLSSRRLYETAQPKLAKHNERRKKYYRFQFDEREGPGALRSVPELLVEIAKDPEIASYIRHIDMVRRQPLDEVCDQDSEEAVSEKMEQHTDTLRGLLAGSSYLTEMGYTNEDIDEWVTRIMEETSHFDQVIDYATAILLTLLPNVESLLLSNHWSHYCVDKSGQMDEDSVDEFGRRVRDLVQLIIQRANDAARTEQSLARLHTIHPVYDVDTQFGADTRALVPFMALESLRVVYDESGFCEAQDQPDDSVGDEGSNHDGDENDPVGSGSEEHDQAEEDSNQRDSSDEDEHAYSEQDNEDANPELGSETGSDEEDGDSHGDYDDFENSKGLHTVITLDGSDSPIPYQNQFICSKYPVLGRNIEEMHLNDYVIDDVACAVLFRDMKKLRHLQMQYSMKDEYGYEWELQSFIDNLGCTVGETLETLHLTCRQLWNDTRLIRNSMRQFKVLRDLSLEMSFFVNTFGSLGKDFNENDFYDPWIGPIVPLIRILPESLETFKIYVPCIDHQHLHRLFKYFKAQREARLPNLKNVTLHILFKDCWGRVFPDHQSERAIIESFAAEHGLDVVASDLPAE